MRIDCNMPVVMRHRDRSCLHVCMYVCVHVFMYVCMYARTYVCMHVCLNVCMLCMDVVMYLCAFDAHFITDTRTCAWNRAWDILSKMGATTIAPAYKVCATASACLHIPNESCWSFSGLIDGFTDVKQPCQLIGDSGATFFPPISRRSEFRSRIDTSEFVGTYKS